jgi:hypothetical protein
MAQPRLKLCHLLWILGLLGLPLSHYALFARTEPFYTGVYSLLWWSFIFACDGLVYALRRRSMLHDNLREFVLLALWSTPVWLLFEVLNFRLENWFYVMVPDELTWGFALLLPAYATVLPGVFEVSDLVVGIVERTTRTGRIEGRPFTVTRRNLRVQMSLGAAMLVLPLVWPEDFFCLVWGFAFLLLDPLCYALGGRSLLRQLASGDNTRLVALLVSGFVCGGLWEAWNIGARTKWIYTVPFFDELKIFEMPVLGFLGFPPFVLECYAIVNAIGLLRSGRYWELSREANLRRPGMGWRRALAGWTLCALACPLAAFGIFRWTVLSGSVPIDIFFREQLPEESVQALRHHDVRHTHQYLALERRPQSIPADWHRYLSRLSRMAELKGIGLYHASILNGMGIGTPSLLAEESPGALASRINERVPAGRAVRPAEVKVWIEAARETTGRPG